MDEPERSGRASLLDWQSVGPVEVGVGAVGEQVGGGRVVPAGGHRRPGLRLRGGQPVAVAGVGAGAVPVGDAGQLPGLAVGVGGRGPGGGRGRGSLALGVVGEAGAAVGLGRELLVRGVPVTRAARGAVRGRYLLRLWGSRTRPPALNWALCGSLVFADEAAKDGPTREPRLRKVRDRVIGPGRAELAAAMGTTSVVMGLVLGQDRPQVPSAEDGHPLGDLCPGGESEPFRRNRSRARCGAKSSRP
jgi:hypothetical protein